MSYSRSNAIPYSSYSSHSKVVDKSINYDNDLSLQRFLSTPFVGSSEKWKRPKVSRGRLIDSGCSDTMICKSTAGRIENVEPATTVEFANGSTASSIGTTETEIAGGLSMKALVFDDGVLTSDLISVSQIVNEENCDVLFTQETVSAIDRSTNRKTVIGRKEKSEKLWQNNGQYPSNGVKRSAAHLAISNTSDAEYVKFSSECFGNPPVSTLIKACQKGWISTFPRLTAKMIRSNPPSSPAISDGHLNRHRQNVQSTDPNKRKRSSSKHSVTIKTFMTSDNHLHCDATGRFPIEAEDGSNYIVVAVFKNYIYAVTMPDRSATSYRTAYQKIFTYFKIHDADVNLIILDNETSALVEQYFESVNVMFQYVPPNDHRSNRAERAIQSFKNHMISSLSTVSTQFPMKKWPMLMDQVLLTLNHLRPWSADHSISAYEGLHKSKFDFNKYQLRPVGTFAKVFIDPSDRETWAPHAESGIYLSPAFNHYRCWKFLILSTDSTRVSNTADFFLNPLLCSDPVENQRVSNKTDDNEEEPSSASPEVPARHVLAPADRLSIRKKTDAESQADGAVQYRKLSKTEKQKPSIQKYRRQVSRRWKDAETNEIFYICDVVIPKKTSGIGSNTPHFKFCHIDQLNMQNVARRFEYTRCSEIMSAKYVTWVDATVAAVIAKEPRSGSRELNLTEAGKPITMGYVLGNIHKTYWEEAQVEEFSRLLDSHTIKHVYKDSIPREHRKNISYYNERAREKTKIIDGKEHIEYRVRGTFGGDHRKYPGAVSSNTAEYPVVKMLLNSVVSDVRNKDKDTRFSTLDLVDFYIGTELENHDDPDYFKIKASKVPIAICQKYNISPDNDDYIYFRLDKCLYGHAVAGRLSNQELVKLLKVAGYYESDLVPCLFKHESRQISFSLIVDDLGVKHTNTEDIQHLIDAISPRWKVKHNPTGDKYIGMNLKWNYDPANPSLEISNAETAPKSFARFDKDNSIKRRKTPSKYTPPVYGKETTDVETEAAPPEHLPEMKNFVQSVNGTYLFYGRIIDYSILEQTNTIGQSQGNPTADTVDQVNHLIGYMKEYPDTKLVVKGNDMQFRVMYDASFMTAHARKSKGGAVYYLSNITDPKELTENIFDVDAFVIPNMCASVAEAEYATAFHSGQKAYFYRNVLEFLGYPQAPTPFYGDNKIAIDISNDACKLRKGKAIDKSYHWFRDRCRLKDFESKWICSDDNVADYFTKPLPLSRHKQLVDKIVTRSH